MDDMNTDESTQGDGMSDDIIERARELLNAATPGPWYCENDDVFDRAHERFVATVDASATAAFIAAAPELVAGLLAALDGASATAKPEAELPAEVDDEDAAVLIRFGSSAGDAGNPVKHETIIGFAEMPTEKALDAYAIELMWEDVRPEHWWEIVE